MTTGTSEPIVVDTVEKMHKIFGDPNFTPAFMGEWGSHPDHAKAVEGVTFDLTKDREALRHWDNVGQRAKKPQMRSIDDDWMT